ncbi:hypothetical protein CAEBREN_17732 [Caenorhabditis brenneri]|uniref:PAN-3 domain-containing protein n=1 Tax=Caenorhabditis brenneri TaxID=135651 RepID=G0PGW6_CAEBE|nr:hypothetical protein CAEBREN_17732 [Caenorhabditis brenneri]
MSRSFISILFLYFPISHGDITKMMIMYGTLTGKSEEAVSLPETNCTQLCLDEIECIAASWTTDNICLIYNMVLSYNDSDHVISIEQSTSDSKSIVAVKTSVSSDICPLLEDNIYGSVPTKRMLNNRYVTYNWRKTSNGWMMKQCSAAIVSRNTTFHLCLKPYSFAQDGNLANGLNHSEAMKFCETKNKTLLGLDRMVEITVPTNLPEVLEIIANNGFVFWLGGRGSDCENGECKTFWTDGWSIWNSTVKTEIINPCLAVANRTFVARECNEKLEGALCAWDFSEF